jgi:hypothetical protein
MMTSAACHCSPSVYQAHKGYKHSQQQQEEEDKQQQQQQH